MNLELLQQLMIENGLAVRAIPPTRRIVVELRHKEEFPDGHAQYLEEFNREMWVEERINSHGGQFVVERNCGTSSTVHFSGKRFYNSLSELIEDVKSCSD